jgi:hypothetical protein
MAARSRLIGATIGRFARRSMASIACNDGGLRPHDKVEVKKMKMRSDEIPLVRYMPHPFHETRRFCQGCCTSETVWWKASKSFPQRRLMPSPEFVFIRAISWIEHTIHESTPIDTKKNRTQLVKIVNCED